MNIPKVTNLESPRTGNKVANQYNIWNDDYSVFQSYSTIIVYKTSGKYFIDPKWDCSVTTLKYFKQFMGLEQYSKKEIERMIKDQPDQYEVKNLN